MIQRDTFKQTRIDEWLVPEDFYFVMGDNRDQSSDSRYWGLVSEEDIVGKAILVWMHKDPGISLPTFLKIDLYGSFLNLTRKTLRRKMPDPYFKKISMIPETKISCLNTPN